MTRQGAGRGPNKTVSTPDRGVIDEDENKTPPYPSPYTDTFLIGVRLLRPDSAKTKTVNNNTGMRDTKTQGCGESSSENDARGKRFPYLAALI